MTNYRAPPGMFLFVRQNIHTKEETQSVATSLRLAMTWLQRHQKDYSQHVYDDKGEWCASYGPPGTCRGPEPSAVT
jgi:hypothetical protein